MPGSLKTAVITGASSGFGEKLAHAAARRGYRVVLVARRAEPLSAVAGAIGERAVAVAADVGDADDCRRVCEAAGRIDLLVNAVGASDRGRLLETPPERVAELVATNALTSLRMTQAAAGRLVESCGTVVNIGSLAGKVAPRFLGGYPAAKFALSAITQQLRLEMAEEGVHVMLVCPGPIRREDAGQRYVAQAADLPSEAARPGGGAKLKGLDPEWLAGRVLDAVERKEPELVLPAKVRLLLALAALMPRWGDRVLRSKTA